VNTIRARRALRVLATATIGVTLASLAQANPAAADGRPPVDTSTGGLLLDKGRFRRLPDVPGAAATVHFRNSNRGQIAGTTVELSSDGPRSFGFLLSGSRVTRIDVPGARHTVALGINDRGQVVGSWSGPDATVNPVTGELNPIHGFLWDKGRYETFDVPGSTNTGLYEINNRGQIVGNYSDKTGVQHGFVLHRGRVTTIDHPLATRMANANGTRVVGINDHGALVGSYGDEQGRLHAWKWAKGRFTDLNPPGGLHAEAKAIDNRGRVVGEYLDATPRLRSFLLEKGRYRLIDVPARCDTAAYGINDRGQIVVAAPGTVDGSTCTSEGVTP